MYMIIMYKKNRWEDILSSWRKFKQSPVMTVETEPSTSPSINHCRISEEEVLIFTALRTSKLLYVCVFVLNRRNKA